MAAAIAPKSVFITGCSRGIGLELVKQLLELKAPPSCVFANYRKDPGGLQGRALKVNLQIRLADGWSI